MKKLTTIFAAIAICFGIATNTFARKAKPCPTIPVTSTIQNSDANFMPYRIQSDLLGAYKNCVDSVDSIIQGIGAWELDMLGSPVRRVYVDFGDPVPGTNPYNLTPPPNGYYPVRFLSNCPTGGPNLLNLALGATAVCRLIIAVDYGADRYSIRFNSENYPGTDEVSWSCTSAASGSCNGWRMQSDPNGSGKLAAQLLKITTSRGKTVEQSYGKYYFSFDISLTKP
jgi:hypothetical protein